jgi:hypothetical protein
MAARIRILGHSENSPPAGTLVDYSGAITAGGTSQQLMAGNPQRCYWQIQNLHASAMLWLNYDAAATAGPGSVRVGPGEMFTPDFISTGVINILGDTTGSTFTCKEG